MTKLLGFLAVAVLSGCVSQARPRAVVTEKADPDVGDLRCQRERMSILDALYYVEGDQPASCGAM